MSLIDGQRDLIEAPETLRDRFAMAALTGILSSHHCAPTFKEAVSASFEIADAMLEARK